MRECSVEYCGNPHEAKGLCNAHYQRLLRHGDPLAGRTHEGGPQNFYREVVLQYEGDDCLAWPFSRNTNGYGQIRVDGRLHLAHRLVCEKVNGPSPTTKHQAAHSCGKGHLGCVNPRHLSWKTRTENEADKLNHGTRSRGERHGASKLTEPEVREIIALKGKKLQKEIAGQFGVSQPTVSNIHRRRNWELVN